MSAAGKRTRLLAVPGLLLGLVVTGTLPAWAGAASDRPADRPAICAADTAHGEATASTGEEQVRC